MLGFASGIKFILLRLGDFYNSGYPIPYKY